METTTTAEPGANAGREETGAPPRPPRAAAPLHRQLAGRAGHGLGGLRRGLMGQRAVGGANCGPIDVWPQILAAHCAGRKTLDVWTAFSRHAAFDPSGNRGRADIEAARQGSLPADNFTGAEKCGFAHAEQSKALPYRCQQELPNPLRITDSKPCTPAQN